MFATLGTVRLDVLTAKGLGIQDGWDYAQHTVVEGKPRLQYVGQRLRDVSLSLRFHRSFCDPEAELFALRALADQAKAALLQLGTGRVLGRFVITDLREDPDWMLENGQAVSIGCALSLMEWADEDTPAPPRRAVQGSPVARRAQPAAAPTPSDPASVPSSSVVRS